MSEHYQSSPKVRTFTPETVSEMTEPEIFHFWQQLRWGSIEFQACPYCGVITTHYYRRHRKQWHCDDCDRTFSVMTNTPFADHKLSYRKMLKGLAYFLIHPKGIPIAQLARNLNVTPKTAQMFMGKLREVLVHSRDTTKLSGTVQIDGAHFGAKPRRPNRRQKLTSEEAEFRIATRKKAIYLTKTGASNAARRFKHRRIVMVLRELHPEPGKGGRRTIVAIARSENETDAFTLARRFIEPGARIMSDEAPAFSVLGKHWQHDVVNHKTEYSTALGVNDNQAESYFSRLRRWEYGTAHNVTSKYLMDYATEIAWREDVRRTDAKTLVAVLGARVMSHGLSIWWRGYCQGHHRKHELLML